MFKIIALNVTVFVALSICQAEQLKVYLPDESKQVYSGELSSSGKTDLQFSVESLKGVNIEGKKLGLVDRKDDSKVIQEKKAEKGFVTFSKVPAGEYRIVPIEGCYGYHFVKVQFTNLLAAAAPAGKLMVKDSENKSLLGEDQVAAGQKRGVNVYVASDSSKSDKSGVKVSLMQATDQHGNKKVSGASTDKSGLVVFPDVSAGNYFLRLDDCSGLMAKIVTAGDKLAAGALPASGGVGAAAGVSTATALAVTAGVIGGSTAIALTTGHGDSAPTPQPSQPPPSPN